MKGPDDADMVMLRQVRAQVRKLCATGDRMLQPQYEHLLGRVEALIEIIETRPDRTDVA